MNAAQLARMRRLEHRFAPPQQWDTPLNGVELARQAGIELDSWQCDVVLGTEPTLICASRQSGKSTAAAVLGVHTILAEPESLVLCVAPGLRQAALLFQACMSVYRKLSNPVRPRQENALNLLLRNGSNLIALPGNEAKIRGYSKVCAVLVDESARVPNDLIAAIKPMIAVSGGRIVALSSPYGRRGWWSDAWHSDEPWSRFEIPATMCKRISSEFLESERRSMSRYYFESEYMCKFLQPEGAVFNADDIAALSDESVKAWSFSARPTRQLVTAMATI